MTEPKIHIVLSELMSGMSEAALARAVDLPKATINRILSGRTPDPRAGTLVPIASYFNVSVEQLLGLSPINSNTPLDIQSNKLVTIPLIKANDICKLTDNTLQQNDLIEISSSNSPHLDKNCFVTHLESDELFPLFSRGSLLIVSRKIKNIQNNDAVIVIDGNIVLFRKYAQLNDTKFLSSPNPKYDIVPFSKEMLIIGKIIEGRLSV